MGCEHLRNLLALPDAEIVAVADRNADSRHWAAVTLGAAHPAMVCGDASELLDRELDAVVIATPNGTHASVLAEIFAARPDLPLLVEKPLCTTVDDCACGNSGQVACNAGGVCGPNAY